MKALQWMALWPTWILIFMAAVTGCANGSADAGGTFFLIEFLDGGKDGIPLNRDLVFRFSSPVAPGQDLAERLKILDLKSGSEQPDSSRAIGLYFVSGDVVLFLPQLPDRRDRSDSGFRPKGSYHVYVKAGADGLRAVGDGRLVSQQEFLFDTSEYYEDPVPAEPPRVLSFVARDPVSQSTTDLSRLDPKPYDLARLDNNALLTAGRFVDPGAGGVAGDYGIRWQLELRISEPLDPATVTTDTVELLEIHGDATDSAENAPPTAGPGHIPATNGHPFKVPIEVAVKQDSLDGGPAHVLIVVTPLVILEDDARYRLTFSGDIMGIDTRKMFIGENGLTGDALTVAEPGGLGYVTEFIVRDRPGLVSQRILTYDPLVDGIAPEKGQSALAEERYNNALYNAVTSPGTAVGFLSEFGDGSDGPLAVTGGNTVVIDTGDLPNAPVGNPFTVQDLNPSEIYNKTSLNTGPVTYTSYDVYELDLESLTVTSSSTLKITGVNPAMLRVSGAVLINGTLDASGGDGENGKPGGTSFGGVAGAGGGAGGDSRDGHAYSFHTHAEHKWVELLTLRPQMAAAGPYSDNGQGPGRGMRGGESYSYEPCNDAKDGVTGTGGGGGSHALDGKRGEDRLNAGGTPGTVGKAYGWVHCGTKGGVNNESVIGMRGMPGPTYGDRAVIENTWGGSGGGAGGNSHGNYRATGGGGGGGGGSVTLLCAGPISVPGGVITVAGGAGGRGYLGTPTSTYAYSTGGGGGGSGGSLVMISGSNIDLTGGIVDARGGAGGARSDFASTIQYGGANAGGDGGHGFIYLMDPDGMITGFQPAGPGGYDTFANGVLTISAFVADRFGPIAAVTELFHVGVSDPRYLETEPGDIVGTVDAGQRIWVYASSARADRDAPLTADVATETTPVVIAIVRPAGLGVAVDVTGSTHLLNPLGIVGRYAFVRIDARFDYDDLTDAALGPFASIDRVDINFKFNE